MLQRSCIKVRVVWVTAVVCCLCCFPLSTKAQVTETTGSSALLGAGCVRPSTLCTAANNSFLLFKDVILPGLEPKSEPQELLKIPRTFGAKLRYEHLDVDGENRTLTGDVYSVTLRQVWSSEE